MTVQKILGLIGKNLLLLVLILGQVVCALVEHHSPKQPDTESGHVFRVATLRSRHMSSHTMYLTSSERSLYHAGTIATFGGVLGVIGQAMIRKRNRAT